MHTSRRFPFAHHHCRAGASGGEERIGGVLLYMFYVYYYTNLYLVVVVAALFGAVFDVHYCNMHSTGTKADKLVCSATGVYAPKCHQNGTSVI